MNTADVALTEEGIRLRVKQIEEQAQEASQYESIRHTVPGKFLIQKLIQRRDRVRQTYKHLPADSQVAQIALAQLQSREREAQELLDLIEGSPARLEKLKEERENLAKAIAQAKKAVQSKPQFMPDALRKEIEK